MIDVGVDRIPPDCQVFIDGRAAHLDAHDFNAGAPAAAEPVSISWGRDSTVDQPDTGTATFTVLQRVIPEADPILRTVHVGAPVQIWSQAVVPPLTGNLIQDPDFNTARNGTLDPSRWVNAPVNRPEQIRATNLMLDPSFEYGTGGWINYNESTVELDSSHGHRGAQSLHLAGGTSPAWGRADFHLNRNTIYTVTLWCFQDFTAAEGLQIRYQPAPGNPQDGEPNQIRGEWTQLTKTFLTEPDAPDRDSIYVRTASAGGEAWIDSASLVQTDSRAPFRGAVYRQCRTATPGVSQGVAFDGTCYYTIRENEIRKFDANWNQIASHDASVDVTATTTHISAPLALDGYLYAPIHNDPHAIIAMWRLDDLSFVGQQLVSGAPDMASAALGWDKDNREFIIPGYYDDEDTLQRFDEHFNYLGSIPTDIVHPQGVFVSGDRIYVQGDWPAAAPVGGPNGRGLISVAKDGTDPIMEIPNDVVEVEGCCLGAYDTVALSYQPQRGQSFRVDEYAVLPPDHERAVFSGDTPAAGGMQYRWTGDPGQSASDQFIPAVHNAAPMVSVERFAGRRCVVLRWPGSYDWHASVVFPPVPYVPDGTNPQAWDLIPQLLPGQTGEVSLWVRLPRGVAGGITAAYTTDPYRPDAITWCNVEGGNLTGDGQWHKLTATVRLPADFDGDGAWILPGLDGGGADPTIWADKGEQTWTDQGNTWDELNAAAAAHPVSLQSEPSLRRVLVWSGEITSAVGQANSDHSIAVAVTASDLGAPIANDNIGDEPWPAEPAATRMSRIVALSRSKPTLTIDPDLQDIQVSYRDVDSQPVQGLLQDLAQTVNGVLWAATHAVNGPYLWVEDTDRRAAVLVFVKPDDGPVSITERSGLDVTKLSAGDLLRDPVQWTTDAGTVMTSVSVSWLEQVPPADGEQASTTEHTAKARNEDLISRYGLRSMSMSTELTSQTDAESLAALLLTQQSRRGDWIVSGLSVDSAWLDRDVDGSNYADRLTATLSLLDGTRRLGAAITVTDAPDYAPRGVIRSAYVEGGQYTFSGGRWQLALTVSPAGGQGSGAAWDELPADWTWTDMDGITWMDAAGVAAPVTAG